MKVTAIMPTHGRKEWAAQAVECFFTQTYADKDLVIFDDSNDPSFDENSFSETSKFGSILTYIRGPEENIAAKRNRCCELAKGELIWTLDSDDWSAPTRMAEQVKQFENLDVQVTGYSAILFYAPQIKQVFKYVGPKTYALGTSLMYRRSFWAENRFPERLRVGEDNFFIKQAGRKLTSFDAGHMIVARIHTGNTCVKQVLQGDNYRPVDVLALPREFPL